MTVQTTTDTASEEIGNAPAAISYRGGSESQRRVAMQVWGVTAVVLLIFGSSLAWTSYGEYPLCGSNEWISGQLTESFRHYRR